MDFNFNYLAEFINSIAECASTIEQQKHSNNPCVDMKPEIVETRTVPETITINNYGEVHFGSMSFGDIILSSTGLFIGCDCDNDDDDDDCDNHDYDRYYYERSRELDRREDAALDARMRFFKANSP